MGIFKLRSRPKGVSMIEFVLLTAVWVPLLIGTLGVGTAMIRSLETIQVSRDAGHMYARNVNFSEAGNKALLARIGANLGLEATGGDGVVILSTITYVGRQQCKAEGLADNSTPPNPYSSCSNYGHFVFTHRLKIGNPSVTSSRFGDPNGALLDSTGYIDSDVYVRNVGARADRFSLLPAPREDGTDGYQAGQSVYVAEAGFLTPSFGGMTDGRTYAHAIF